MTATFNYGECESNNVMGHVKLKDMGMWLALHGCDVGATENGRMTKYFVNIPIVCKNMGFDDNTKKTFCGDYENRPDICKRFKCGGL
jgi:hypothetical protein